MFNYLYFVEFLVFFTLISDPKTVNEVVKKTNILDILYDIMTTCRSLFLAFSRGKSTL